MFPFKLKMLVYHGKSSITTRLLNVSFFCINCVETNSRIPTNNKNVSKPILWHAITSWENKTQEKKNNQRKDLVVIDDTIYW